MTAYHFHIIKTNTYFYAKEMSVIICREATTRERNIKIAVRVEVRHEHLGITGDLREQFIVAGT